MNITLTRNPFRADGITGTLYDEKAHRITDTLEHAFDGKPKLPAGVYTCRRRLSPHFGFELFVIEGVPGHDFMEIHPGNKQNDSNGCVLVGTASGGPLLYRSREAFDYLMWLQHGLDTFTLTVIDA